MMFCFDCLLQAEATAQAGDRARPALRGRLRPIRDRHRLSRPACQRVGRAIGGPGRKRPRRNRQSARTRSVEQLGARRARRLAFGSRASRRPRLRLGALRRAARRKASRIFARRSLSSPTACSSTFTSRSRSLALDVEKFRAEAATRLGGGPEGSAHRRVDAANARARRQTPWPLWNAAATSKSLRSFTSCKAIPTISIRSSPNPTDYWRTHTIRAIQSTAFDRATGPASMD